jgi:hypothetical protein
MMDANNKRLNRMKRIEAIARWVSLMGIAGLIAQITQTAWAEDAPIINPYAPSDDMGTAEDPQFEGDVQGDGASFFPEDGNQGINPSANASPSQNAGGRAAKAGATGGKRPGRVSIGGAPPSGVTQHSQVQALTVDANTGEGCKDIVTDFNFPDAEIMDIAKALGKLVGKNFILDNKDVKGKISIISNSPITCGDAWKAFLTALDMNNFALIPSGKYIRIARTRDARDKQLKTYTGNYTPDTDALITRLFPLKYLSGKRRVIKASVSGV